MIALAVFIAGAVGVYLGYTLGMRMGFERGATVAMGAFCLGAVKAGHGGQVLKEVLEAARTLPLEHVHAAYEVLKEGIENADSTK